MANELMIAFGSGIITLLFAIYLIYWVLKQPTGNVKMQEIALAIQIGATAYLF